MHEQDMAIVKGLIPMAWADGVFAAKEKEIIFALLDAFDATEEQKKALNEYAKERRTLYDIDLQELSAPDRRVLLQHAVLLSYVEGEQGAAEKELLTNLVLKLKIPADEARAILDASAARAQKLTKHL